MNDSIVSFSFQSYLKYTESYYIIYIAHLHNYLHYF